MAKDGTNRGGARIGAGRKPKSLNDKIKEGKSAKVLTSPVELMGEDVPPVRDFLKSPQAKGKELV
ncbi:MAG: terminase, partial [Ruminococcus sp.]|nr:terminase [Ruminococcus sp.]